MDPRLEPSWDCTCCYISTANMIDLDQQYCVCGFWWCWRWCGLEFTDWGMLGGGSGDVFMEADQFLGESVSQGVVISLLSYEFYYIQNDDMVEG